MIRAEAGRRHGAYDRHVKLGDTLIGRVAARVDARRFAVVHRLLAFAGELADGREGVVHAARMAGGGVAQIGKGIWGAAGHLAPRPAARAGLLTRAALRRWSAGWT